MELDEFVSRFGYDAILRYKLQLEAAREEYRLSRIRAGKSYHHREIYPVVRHLCSESCMICERRNNNGSGSTSY